MRKLVLPPGLAPIHAQLEEINAMRNAEDNKVYYAAKILAHFISKSFDRSPRIQKFFNLPAKSYDPQTGINANRYPATTFLEAVCIDAVLAVPESRFSDTLMYVDKDNLLKIQFDIEDSKCEESLRQFCKTITSWSDNYLLIYPLNLNPAENSNCVEFSVNCNFTARVMPVLEMQS